MLKKFVTVVLITLATLTIATPVLALESQSVEQQYVKTVNHQFYDVDKNTNLIKNEIYGREGRRKAHTGAAGGAKK